jgi:hypothetical protein
MAVELILAPEVEQDVSEAYEWYEQRRPGLGEEFLGCVDACIQHVCRSPEHYTRFTKAIDGQWSGDFLTPSFTNMSTTPLLSIAYFTRLEIPTNGASGCPDFNEYLKLSNVRQLGTTWVNH